MRDDWIDMSQLRLLCLQLYSKRQQVCMYMCRAIKL